MKIGQYSEEKIISVLKEADAGAKVADLCRQHGISDVTFYCWKSKYAGLALSELRRLKTLEEVAIRRNVQADCAEQRDAKVLHAQACDARRIYRNAGVA